MRECLGVGGWCVHTCNQRPSHPFAARLHPTHSHHSRAHTRTHTHTKCHTHQSSCHSHTLDLHTHTFFFFRCNGAVELVDASEMLPDLERRPGWKSWKVLDEDLNDW